MRLSIILILISTLTFSLMAQNSYSTVKRCGTDNYVANKILNDSNYLKIVEQTRLLREEIGARSSNKRVQACPNGNLIIPVAVHFDSGIGTSIRERTCLLSLVNEQMRVLNEAFNGLNDSGCSTTPTNGACITFKLANNNHTSESGLQNGEPAITYNGEFTCPRSTPCNLTYWSGYLNIIVQNMLGFGGPLGIAPLNGSPGASGSANSILVDACGFGTEDIYCSQAGPNSCGTDFSYRHGYTTVHEAGHFYGLDHTFCSDDGGNPEGGDRCNCGFFNCDGFSDTPAQCHSNYTCFSGTCSETIRNPCGGTAIFNNFMDYLVDNCMNSFTNQQTTFMNDLADRDSYKQSALDDIAPDCDFSLRIDEEKRTVSESETLTLCGSSDFFIEETVLNNPENYNWTFTTTNGLQVNINSSTEANPVLRLSGNSGQLIINLTASNAGGTCSSTSKTFNIQPSLDFVANTNNVECLNNNVAGVELELGDTNGNVSFSPSNLVTGSGTSTDPYLALVNLDQQCEPIAFTAFDEGLMVEKGILEILEPSNIAGGYEVGTNDPNQFGVDIETVSPCIQGDLVIVNDGSGITTDFCQPASTSQCNNLNGNIAVIDRGDCFFVDKIESAQACGAIAVIICNCEPFSENCNANSSTEILNMSGDSNNINIPSIFVSYNNCQLIKSSLNQQNVRACIGAPSTSPCAQTVSINPCNISACSSNIVNGCTNPCAANFNPQATQNDGSCNNLITASINNLPAFTSNDNSIQLSGSPSGGTFSGNGVIFSTFNPNVVNIGMHTITYTYSNNNGCEVSAAKSILVSQINYNFVQYQLDFISP